MGTVLGIVKVALSQAQCKFGGSFDSQVSIYICMGGLLSVTILDRVLRY